MCPQQQQQDEEDDDDEEEEEKPQVGPHRRTVTASAVAAAQAGQSEQPSSSTSTSTTTTATCGRHHPCYRRQLLSKTNMYLYTNSLVVPLRLLGQVFITAYGGQRLSQLTIFVWFHLFLHIVHHLHYYNVDVDVIGSSISSNNNNDNDNDHLPNANTITTTTTTTTISISTAEGSSSWYCYCWSWYWCSVVLLFFEMCICTCGYVLLFLLYRHSVRTIFNRQLPSTMEGWLPSFVGHWTMLQPLSILWRYVTAQWRVLPDVIVLGQVRCGTTTLCHYFTESNCRSIAAHVPFCLWDHPELRNKETFYFVGHYLGFVHPTYYRMCFPLFVTRWFHNQQQTVRAWWSKRRQPLSQMTHHLNHPSTYFWTFDGCAQYLSHPAVPSLLVQAYREAGQAPPVLVVCVRNPLDQALSWWRYEHAAMEWGAQMNLTQWNTELRTRQYPPRSISDALDYSSSKVVEESFQKAQDLFSAVKDTDDDKDDDNKSDGNSSSGSSSFVLPPWAMTWPGGQLAGIGRNGNYLQDIMRYERAFDDAFSSAHDQACKDDSNHNHNDNKNQWSSGDDRCQRYADNLVRNTSKLKYVNVVPLDFLKDKEKLEMTLRSITRQVEARQQKQKQLDAAARGIPSMRRTHSTTSSGRTTTTTNGGKVHIVNENGLIHRNASSDVSSSSTCLEPTRAEMQRLENMFAKDSAELGAMTGLKLDWMQLTSTSSSSSAAAAQRR